MVGRLELIGFVMLKRGTKKFGKYLRFVRNSALQIQTLKKSLKIWIWNSKVYEIRIKSQQISKNRSEPKNTFEFSHKINLLTLKTHIWKYYLKVI